MSLLVCSWLPTNKWGNICDGKESLAATAAIELEPELGLGVVGEADELAKTFVGCDLVGVETMDEANGMLVGLNCRCMGLLTFVVMITINYIYIRI